MCRRWLAMFVLVACIAPCANAQVRDTGEPVSLPFSRTYTLASRATGRDYRLFVLTPAGYSSNPGDTTRYPVLYMGDGDISMPLAFHLHRSLRAGRVVRDIIIVGVGYPQGELGFRRAEESTPTSLPGFDTTWMAPRKLKTGGAPGLFRVMRDEVIPFIEANDRVTEERAYIGVSLSGLFAAYGLFEDPRLFKHWVLGSPSLWWDNRWAIRREADYAKGHKELPANVYLWVGATNDITDHVLHFAEQLRIRGYGGLRVTSGVVPGGIHESSWHDNLYRALKVIFPVQSASP